MHLSMRVVLLAALVLIVPTVVYADVDGAKGYLKEAEEIAGGNSVNSSDIEKANSKLELAEAELDGVAEAAKAPVLAAIKAVKEKINAKAHASDKPKYMRMLTRAMDEAEGSIGNLATWSTAERMFNDVNNNAEAKIVIGAELEVAAKKFATFKRLNAKKAGAKRAEEIKESLASIEKEWAERKPELLDPDGAPNSKANSIDRLTRSIESLRKRITEQLPADDENGKVISVQLDTIAAEFTKIALADRIKEVSETLKRKIDLYKDDWGGYEKETAGPTWAQYSQQQSEKMSKFLAPLSVEYVTRADEFLAGLNEEEDYKSVQADPSIKAIIASVKTKRDATYAKLLKFVTAVVEGAEKAGVKETDVLDNLESNVRLALGEKSPEGVAIRERLKKKSTDQAAAANGAEEAKVALAKMLHEKADAAWPKLYAGMTWETKADLSKPAAFKGKSIGFLSDNLMGYRFKPDTYYFATTIGGIPVAATFDPALKAQIAETEKAIGRSLGDNDDDGKWDIIAVVTDKKTKLMSKRQAESTGKVDGADVKITTDYAVEVDAVVIEIIAAKCGPFAGAKGRGVLKIDGTVGK
ncbi:MAG: hypothetical protein WCT04_24570 [Planctomycetota bacterium]